MKTKLALLAGLLALPGLSPASEQPALAAVHGQAAWTESDRRLITGHILLKWGGYAEKAEGQDRRKWAAALWPLLAKADWSSLQRAARAVTYQGMRNALGNQHSSVAATDVRAGDPNGAIAKALGGLAADLVFTPVAPCRIVDTRVNNDRLAAGSTRSLVASNPGGGFSDQGGSATNCGIPDNPAALALSVTALNNASTGYLRVFPANGTSTQGSPVSMTRVNTVVNNDIIVATCQACASDLKVFTTVSTHYAAFVTGYFMAPLATSPDCVNVTGEYVNGAPGTGARLPIVQCPASFTKVSRGVEGIGQLGKSSIYFGALNVYSVSPTYGFFAAELATCCRVPGR